jgi:hypothetical protein
MPYGDATAEASGSPASLHTEASNTAFQQGIIAAEAHTELSQHPIHEVMFGRMALAALSCLCTNITQQLQEGHAQAAVLLQGQLL